MACHRFGSAHNRSLRKRTTGLLGLLGAAKAVASHRTPSFYLVATTRRQAALARAMAR